MIMAPIPSDSVKNAWPSASRSPAESNSPKSGLKMNVRARPDPSMVRALTNRSSRIPNRMGRRSLAVRSMPPFTPDSTTNTVAPMNNAESRICSPAGCGEGAEGVPHLGARGEATHAPTERLREVVERPPGDDRVVAQDDEAGENAQTAHESPGGTERRLHGADGALLGFPADQELRHHDGEAYSENAGQVDQYEGAAAIFPRDVWEFPEVPRPMALPVAARMNPTLELQWSRC